MLFKTFRQVTVMVALGLTAMMQFGMAPAHAAPTDGYFFVVNSPADQTDANIGDGKCKSAAGKCTLRAAVQEANAQGGYEYITLPNGVYKLTLGGNDDNAAQGDLDVNVNLSILGQDQTLTIIDGNDLDRVFENKTHEFGLGHVTVRNGAAGNKDGGAIWNGGSLWLDHVIFKNNSAKNGGGIFNQGNLFMASSTLDSNTATLGGGLFESSAANSSLYIEGSTLANNYAKNNGGGIYNQGGHLPVKNSTLALNRADNHGGGLYNAQFQNNDVATSFYFATITQNTSDNDQKNGGDGGGIYAEANTSVYLQGTILAQNTDKTVVPQPAYQPHDCYGTLNGSGGGNIVGNNQGCLGISSGNNNQVGTPSQPVLAELDSLADNGGPTQTALPKKGSPARDVLDYDGCAGDSGGQDQRSYVRTRPCDVGAVEVGGTCGSLADDSMELFSPKDGSKIKKTTSVTLNWVRLDCASTYTVEVRQDGPDGPKVFKKKNLTASSITATFAKGHKYYWSVKVCNAKGCISSYVWEFRVK